MTAVFLPACDVPGTCESFYEEDIPYMQYDFMEFDELHGSTVAINSTEDLEYEVPSKSDFFVSLSHRQEDFLMSCMWHNTDVCETHMESTITEMGQCWTFNGNISQRFVSDRTGEQNGVGFWINIESYEQFQNYDDDSGIKVHLHPQDEIPQVGDQGFAIPLATHCLASITYTKTTSLPYPKGSCQDKQLTTYKAYSRAKCENECRSAHITDRCRCHPSHLPYMLKDFEDCDFNQTINCVDQLASADQYDDKLCNCPDSCHRNVYGVKLSYADITGRMLPHVNKTLLHDKVRRGLSLKHRLQVDEFEKTLNLLEEFEISIRDMLVEIEQLMNIETSPVNKLISEEYELQRQIFFDLYWLLFGVPSYNKVYDDFTHPYITKRIRVINTAIEDLSNLQNNMIDQVRAQQDRVLLNDAVKHVTNSLQAAMLEVEDVLRWPEHVHVLVQHYGLDLNNEFCFHSSYQSAFADQIQSIIYTLGNITSDLQENDNSSHQIPLGNESLMFHIVTESKTFFACLEEYGSHLKEGKTLREKLSKESDLAKFEIIQLDKDLTSFLELVHSVMKDAKDAYYRDEMSKHIMLSHYFSTSVKDRMMNRIQGKW